MKVLYRPTPVAYPLAFEEGRLTHPERLHFTYYVGGVPGRRTCKAQCDYCFIPFTVGNATPHTLANLAAKIEKEKRQLADLQAQGFDTTVMIPDTFAWDGAYLRSGLLNHNILYDQEGLNEKGVAWTSGAPLLAGDTTALLDLAHESNLSVLAMTSHGTRDKEIPIAGTIQPSTVRAVVDRFNAYRATRPDAGWQLSLGFPIGKHNIDRVEEYIAYAASLGADYLRFNRLLDLTTDGRFRQLMLEPADNAAFFAKMARLEELSFAELASPTLEQTGTGQTNQDIRIMVSTDFGFEGFDSEQKGPINVCPGGTNLFGIFYDTIFPCNELFDMSVGHLVEQPASESPFLSEERVGTIHVPEFDQERIIALEKLVQSQEHKGCIGHTIRTLQWKRK